MTNKEMRGRMKKVFACTLSAAVIMSSTAVPAFASEDDFTVEAETEDAETQADAFDDAEEVETEEPSDVEEDTENAPDQTEEFTAEDAAFDDGTAEAAGDWWDEEPSQSTSTDLVDMSDKNPIEVTNANISDIFHQNGPSYTENKYYQLTEDIVLSGWSTAEYFAGTLDGNGHTITLQDNSSCFVHYLSSKGTLQNIGFLGSVTTSVGALANSGDACVVATCQGKILNCYMKMTYGSGCKYAAGFIGQTQAQAIVSNCAVHAVRTADGENKFYPLAQEAVNASKIFNCYWDSESRDDTSKWADYRGVRAVIDSADVHDCTQESNTDMLTKLNDYKGANSVAWVAGEDGFPVLSKPEVQEKYTVSFTKADGTVINDVQKNGFSLKLQDVPANQNAGTLKLDGFDGKVAWLLSQYDSGKPSYEWEEDSNIWPSIYEGGLAVKGTGEATIVAWDEATLSHTVDKQDVPDENSVELARFKVTVTAGKVEAIRLVANGNEIQDNNLTVQGSEWVTLQPQTKEEGSDVWENVPVSSIEFPKSTEDTYEAYVTNKEAKYRAKKPGTFELKITGFDKEYTVNVTSEYVPVESIAPAVNGTVKVYPSNYQGDGSQHNLGVALTSGTFNQNVVVTPANASYAYNWTMDTSDASVAEYTFDQGGTTGIVPKKSGEVTLTATSADPQLKKQVSGSATVKFVYADEVAAKVFWDLMATVPEPDKITKDNATLLKDARFIYDNLSQDNKIATGDDMPEQLTQCEAKLAELNKPASEPVKKPTPATTQKPVKAAITLNYKTLPLAVKQSTSAIKISKTNIKGDTIKTAKSSNRKVVAVSVKNGKLTVKGLKKGTAVVTVTSQKGAVAKVTVTVQKKAVTLKKLSAAVKQKQTVKKGKKVTLKVAKTPVTAAGTVKWTSSNKKVASVSSKGVVKGLRRGTAVITAKVGKKTVKFKVTVK